MTEHKLPAGIRERGDKHQVRYYTPDGRRHAQSFDGITAAKRFKRGVDAARDKGELLDPRLGSVAYAEWVDEWWTTTHHLKPKTRAGYGSLFRTHLLPEFGGTRLARITTPQVRAWVASLDSRGLSSSRIRQAYGLLKLTMKAAVESGYIARTPCVGVKVARAPKRDQLVIAPEQVAVLAEEVTEPYGVLIYLLAYSGLRWGEATALRRKRCDPLRSRLEVVESVAEIGGTLHYGETKTYARRFARLPRFISDMLAEHLAHRVGRDGDALVFTAPGGQPLRYSNFRARVWNPAVVRTDETPGGLTPHHLRHTCASYLIARGASVKAVQVQLGHSTPVVTLNTYLHLFPDDLDRLFDDVDDAYRETKPEHKGDHRGTKRGPAVVPIAAKGR